MKKFPIKILYLEIFFCLNYSITLKNNRISIIKIKKFEFIDQLINQLKVINDNSPVNGLQLASDKLILFIEYRQLFSYYDANE